MLADERFWQRVTRGDGCWEWQGKPGPRGFGQVKIDGRPQLAHRAAWFFTHGAWPAGEIGQSCGNRLCVRPEHLRAEGSVVLVKPVRRQRGSGSVQPRGEKVRIRASVKDPVTGRRIQPSFTVPPRGIKDEVDRVRTELATGRHQGTAVTFGELLDKALLVHAPNLSPTAQDTFRNYAKYLKPLRDYPLRRLEEHPEIVEEFYAAGVPGLRGNGKLLNPKSVRHVHWVLSQAFHAAKRWRWIRHDPSQDIRLPPVPQDEPESPPVEGVRALLAAAGEVDTAFPLFIRLAAIAGGRRGELHAIRFTDIDVDRKVIELRRNYVRAQGVWGEKASTKTGRARYIDIDEGTMALIAAERDRLEGIAAMVGCALPDNAFLFSKEPDGSAPWSPEATARWYKALCKKFGIAESRITDLRHFMNTELIDGGFPVTVASDRSGHRRTSTTTDIYSARLRRRQPEAAAYLAGILDEQEAGKTPT
jgi:integrase